MITALLAVVVAAGPSGASAAVAALAGFGAAAVLVATSAARGPSERLLTIGLAGVVVTLAAVELAGGARDASGAPHAFPMVAMAAAAIAFAALYVLTALWLRWRMVSPAGVLIDGAMFGSALALLAWLAVMEDTATTLEWSVIERVVASLVVLGASSTMVLHGELAIGHARTAGRRLTSLGFMLSALAVALEVATASSVREPAPLDVLLVIGWGLVAAGALHPSARGHTARGVDQPSPLTTARLCAIGAALGVLPVAIVWAVPGWRAVDEAVLGTALIVLAVLRIALLARESQHRQQVIMDRDRRYVALMEHAVDAVLLLDAAGRVAHASPACERLVGRQPSELLGVRFVDLVVPEDAMDVEAALALVSAGDPVTSVAARFSAAGEVRVTQCTLADRLGVPGVESLTVTVHDVTEQVRAREEAERRSHLDPVTQLPSRLVLQEEVARRQARAAAGGGTPPVVVACGVDRLDLVAEAFGSAAGDDVLRQAAGRLGAVVTASCDRAMLAHLGDDRFAVVLDDADDAEILAAELLTCCHAPFDVAGNALRLGASLGIGGPIEGGEPLADALAAVHAVRLAGGGRLHRAVIADRVATQRRLAVEVALRDAIRTHSLRLVLQPIFVVPDRVIVAAEALCRFDDPALGIVPPSEFIPVAEETGLIDQMFALQLEQLAEVVAMIEAQGLPVPQLGLNVSGRQLGTAEDAERFLRAVESSAMPLGRLAVELTESVLMEGQGPAAAALTLLRDRGVLIVADDFGTGYSSLSRLRDLPVQVVKLDRSFLVGLPDDQASRIMVGAMAGACGRLGMLVLAEGVETEEQLACSVELGCSSAQGYLLSAPLSPAELVRRLATDHAAAGTPG